MAACQNGRLTFSKGPPGGDTILTWSSVGLSDHIHPACMALRAHLLRRPEPVESALEMLRSRQKCSSDVSVRLSVDPLCHVEFLVIQAWTVLPKSLQG